MTSNKPGNLNKKRSPARPETALKTKGETRSKAPERRYTKVSFPVVALGASAGGLEAFTKFLNQIPEDSGIAYVLVQHLDPTHTSSLPELLSRQSAIPVLEATNETKLKPDHIYVIPSGKSMYIHKRTLSLVEQPIPGLSHSIDIFFKSLAEDLKDRAIGVILSGTGSDGVEGARAIKLKNGMIIVQKPDSAKYDGMPRAAIQAGVQDKVLRPEMMVENIMEFISNSGLKTSDIQEPPEPEDDALKELLSIIKAKTRHDFSGYKITSINRRIKRRMSLNQIATLKDYGSYVRDNPLEIDALIKEFLINVTSFFRDTQAFEIFKQEICTLAKNKNEGSEVRVWVPGCASGEEAYSIAILLEECLKDIKKNLQIQVFGTDLDTEAITAARIGNFPLNIAPDVGEERLKQFFKKYNNSYKINKELRDKLVFAVHDVIDDAPYSRMDIISLRNVLIYLDLKIQKKILAKLHYSLNKDGILFLGTAETIGEDTDLFAVVDRKWRIYRCINKDKLPLGQVEDDLTRRKIVPSNIAEAWDPIQLAIKPANLSEHLLLEALPPSVLIDPRYQVIFTHGNTGKYLQLPEGKPEIGLMHLVNQNLRTALSTALREASETGQIATRLGLPSKQTDGTMSIKITVSPLFKPVPAFVITFEDVLKPKLRKNDKLNEISPNTAELEQELRDIKESLRSTVEELETANEELKTSNEEFQSTNEELQSANEELESSREELQSTNEELETINTEHQNKIEQLDTVNDDMNNLLNSTNVATIFLDEQLKILRFTPAMTSLFNFVETDKGRPIGHITSHMKSGSLVQSAHKVLENLIPVEQTIETDSGKWFSMRVFPYRTTDNSIAGVVVSFIDINKERMALNYAQSIIDTVREAIVVLDQGLQIVSVNKSFYKTFHLNRKNMEGQHIYKLGKGKWAIPELRKLLDKILAEDKIFNNYRMEYKYSDIEPRVMLINARRIRTELGNKQRILLAMEDITDRSELLLKKAEATSTHKKEKNKLDRKSK